MTGAQAYQGAITTLQGDISSIISFFKASNLVPNYKWSFVDQYGTNTTRKILGFANVKTPFKTFKDCLIVEEGNSYSGTLIVYAPNIGMIKRDVINGNKYNPEATLTSIGKYINLKQFQGLKVT